MLPAGGVAPGRGAPSSKELLAKLRQRNALAASDGADPGEADPQVRGSGPPHLSLDSQWHDLRTLI